MVVTSGVGSVSGLIPMTRNEVPTSIDEDITLGEGLGEGGEEIKNLKTLDKKLDSKLNKLIKALS